MNVGGEFEFSSRGVGCTSALERRSLLETVTMERRSAARSIYLRTTTPWRRVARWAGYSSSDSEEHSEPSE